MSNEALLIRRNLKKIYALIKQNFDEAFNEECNAKNSIGRDHWMPARIAHEKDLAIIEAEIKELENGERRE